MTVEADPTQDEVPKKGGKLPLILGVVLAIVGGGGGYFVVSSGAIGGSSENEEISAKEEDTAEVDSLPPIAFVPLEPILVSLPRNGDYNVLRFRAELEINAGYEEEVAAITPRIVDVLNGYLRAVTLEELADPTILGRLRSQMLRRVQTVAGEGRVRDILIMEFVLN
jgi:flagellar FliL protein